MKKHLDYDNDVFLIIASIFIVLFFEQRLWPSYVLPFLPIVQQQQLLLFEYFCVS